MVCSHCKNLFSVKTPFRHPACLSNKLQLFSAPTWHFQHASSGVKCHGRCSSSTWRFKTNTRALHRGHSRLAVFFPDPVLAGWSVTGETGADAGVSTGAVEETTGTLADPDRPPIICLCDGGLPPYPRSFVKLTLMTWLGSSTLVDVEGPPIICSWDGKVPPNPLSWLNDARTTWLGSSTYTHRTDGGDGILSDRLGAETVSAPIWTTCWTWEGSPGLRESPTSVLSRLCSRRLPPWLWRPPLSRALPLCWTLPLPWSLSCRSLWLQLTALLPWPCSLDRPRLLPVRFWLRYGRYLSRSRCSRRSWWRLSAKAPLCPRLPSRFSRCRGLLRWSWVQERSLSTTTVREWLWSLRPPARSSRWRDLPGRSSRGRVLSTTTVRPWRSPRNPEYLSSSLLPVICQT